MRLLYDDDETPDMDDGKGLGGHCGDWKAFGCSSGAERARVRSHTARSPVYLVGHSGQTARCRLIDTTHCWPQCAELAMP